MFINGPAGKSGHFLPFLNFQILAWFAGPSSLGKNLDNFPGLKSSAVLGSSHKDRFCIPLNLCHLLVWLQFREQGRGYKEDVTHVR